MTQKIKNIVIVGGGTAGWITAGLLAVEHNANNKENINITLIESPDVKTIGVGEGTWPSMRNTLNKMGISETEFIQSCDASFKQGSQFINWQGYKQNDVYHHPFMEPDGYTRTNLHHAWCQQNNQDKTKNKSFADTVGVQSKVCEAGLAPKQLNTPEYAAVTNYGYHLDAGKFVTLLQKHCTQSLGVKYLQDHVERVNSADNGDIASITTKLLGDISGDLFVDCSGSKSLLLGEHFDVPFISKRHILFNDTALAAQVPYTRENKNIASTTLSTAQSAGWIWDIGLPSRRGVGYTYSSRHTDEQTARADLINYITASIGKENAEKIKVKKLSFIPGYREKFWHKNCVAIGMSAGFLEPLEASALAMIELSATMLCEELPVNSEHMEIIASRFNDRFHYRWQRTIEFLKMHYVLSQRRDTVYWRENQLHESIPERLQQLLSLWRHQPPSRYDLIQNEEIFPSASYQYVLYGMNFETKNRTNQRKIDNVNLAIDIFKNNETKLTQYLAGLPSNRDLIDQICQRQLSLTGDKVAIKHES